jgi:hypothetical protein
MIKILLTLIMLLSLVSCYKKPFQLVEKGSAVLPDDGLGYVLFTGNGYLEGHETTVGLYLKKISKSLPHPDYSDPFTPLYIGGHKIRKDGYTLEGINPGIYIVEQLYTETPENFGDGFWDINTHQRYEYYSKRTEAYEPLTRQARYGKFVVERGKVNYIGDIDVYFRSPMINNSPMSGFFINTKDRAEKAKQWLHPNLRRHFVKSLMTMSKDRSCIDNPKACLRIKK